MQRSKVLIVSHNLYDAIMAVNIRISTGIEMVETKLHNNDNEANDYAATVSVKGCLNGYC